MWARRRTGLRNAGAALLALLLAGAVIGPRLTGDASAISPSVTISAGPNPLVIGQSVVLLGRVRGATHAVSVTLWQKLPGDHAFSVVTQAQTTPKGSYVIRLPGGSVSTNRSWYVSSGGVNSPTLNEAVRGLVTISASSATPRTRHRVTIRAAAAPSGQGERLVIQIRKHGRWTRLKSVSLAGRLGVALRRRFKHRGTVRLRAVLAPNAYSLGGRSATMTLTVGPLRGIHKIQHVVIIMQENRSFDSYFGTYPGADGIPHGVCMPDPQHGDCIKPYHDPNDIDAGADHTAQAAAIDIAQGR
jgi:hypothetical protein